MPRTAVALGSNLGDRQAHLTAAITQLSQVIDNLVVSPFFDTAPVGVPDVQPRYLNAAAIGESSLAADILLQRLLDLEQRAGRRRPSFLAARTLDLDLILYGDEVAFGPGLSIPHPRFRERRFVLEPLAAIAPDWIDPVTGRTVAELLRALDPQK